MVKKFLAVGAVAALALTFAANVVAAPVHVKKVIADSMTADELAAYKQRLEERAAAGAFDNAPGGPERAPGDTCAAATPEISTLPFNPAGDTTVGATDNFDLPADTAAPTCTASSTCTGAGPAGSLPRGGIYTGTGTGPDRAYSIQVNTACTLSITMDPAAADLALIVYQTACSNSLADCVCVDDTGGGGTAEVVSLQAVPGTTYFIVTDGYSAGATPPGPSDAYTISVTETTATGCQFVPVELQGFEVER